MVNSQIVRPCGRIRPQLVSKVCLSKRSSNLVQWDVSSIGTTDTSRKASHSILGLAISQVSRTVWHAHVPWVQKFCTERRECMKKKCTSRLTLVASAMSSKVHPLPRYRSVPKRRSSIGETFLLLCLPVKPSAWVRHRSNNPSQSSPLTHSKICRYDRYGNRNRCRNSLFQVGQSGSGFWT